MQLACTFYECLSLPHECTVDDIDGSFYQIDATLHFEVNAAPKQPEAYNKF